MAPKPGEDTRPSPMRPNPDATLKATDQMSYAEMVESGGLAIDRGRMVAVAPGIGIKTADHVVVVQEATEDEKAMIAAYQRMMTTAYNRIAKGIENGQGPNDPSSPSVATALAALEVARR